MGRPRKSVSEVQVAPGTERAAQDFARAQAEVNREAQPTRESVTRERMPFDSYTKKMDVYIPPDSPLLREYHLYKFVDRGGRIERAKAAGYDFVYRHEVGLDSGVEARANDLGNVVSWVSGTSEKGDSETTYLMKIPKEYWEEDQAAIQSQVDAVDGAIRRGQVGNTMGAKSYVRTVTYDSKLSNPN